MEACGVRTFASRAGSRMEFPKGRRRNRRHDCDRIARELWRAFGILPLVHGRSGADRRANRAFSPRFCRADLYCGREGPAELARPKMTLDPVFLDRVQTGFTFAFHIIFPSFTIGLSAYVATLAVMWIATGEERFHRLAFFWTKIFAVSFAMGVVSGIVLSYQFGTNWSRFSVVTGNVIGPLIGYEVLTAFFLEATFLGVLLFGWNRVPPWLSTLAAAIVAVGTSISAFWILSANSWMQTPAGHELRDGIAYPLDWLAVISNPSFPYRLAHMLTAAYLTTAFVVLAVGARYLLALRHSEEARTML